MTHLKICTLLTALALVGCSEDAADALERSGAPPAITLEPTAKAVRSDPEAAGDEAAVLYQTGDRARFGLDGVQSGTYKIEVRVRGDFYEGWPEMRLSVDGERRGEDIPVEHSSYSDERFGELDLSVGQSVDVTFSNDNWGGSAEKDRNLYVDYLALTPVADAKPAPTEPAPAPEDAGLKDLAGSTLMGSIMNGGNLNLQIYRDTYQKELNAGYAAGFGGREWSGPGQYDFDEVNRVINWYESLGFVTTAGIPVRPNHYLGDWLRYGDRSAEELEALMEDMIGALMASNNNADKVEVWSVVNEALWLPGGAWYAGTIWNSLGDEPDQSGLEGAAKVMDSHKSYVRKALEVADRHTDAKLELRERRVAFPGDDHYDAFYQLVKHLLNVGAPLDVVALQTHLNAEEAYDWDGFRDNIRRYKDLGLEVHLAELDIGNDGTEAGRRAQRETYYRAVKAAREGGADLINFWGVRDGQMGSYREGEYALLFEGVDMTPKPAYEGVRAALTETR